MTINRFPSPIGLALPRDADRWLRFDEAVQKPRITQLHCGTIVISLPEAILENVRSGNSICHIVIPAPDLAKAKSFYEAVFGWRVRANIPGPKYWFFDSGNVGGAFSSDHTPSEGSIVLVVKVDDMLAVLDLVTAHGGTVRQSPGRIGEAAAGYDAYFLDPNGNEIGVYSNQSNQ